MNISRLSLNPQKRGARKLMGSPEAMHAAVRSGFAPGTDPGRVLWRVDSKEHGQATLYVVSAVEPDLEHVAEQAGWPTQAPAESRPYDPLLSRLKAGQRWAFRLTANPVHRGRLSDGTQKIMGHVTVDQQLSWLMDRQERIGLALETADQEPTAAVIARSVLTFRRQTSRVTVSSVTYEGVGVVTEPEALRTALTQGIGRAKAYGCGLMTLAVP
ncbi:CRISPR-associated protein, Cse3 family [Raineyella antarctica]|uniref:CRISPR-associated protein, Cse3 family n=1 Tax=Raineyella antarctica TaxID=1577474 RepID=A0A1G6H5Y3_9ACTN|nr:type I-E CRISPR-associated protein Cas6/Cse3/CasE [Raineyella antarctica]SDB89669.1 CRISPR-associated protein, Cse3 family [Raineyella antarctica]